MGVPYAEILGNHSKGLPVRFYTLWADSCLIRQAQSGQKRSKAAIIGQRQQTASFTRKLFRREHGNQIVGDGSHD